LVLVIEAGVSLMDGEIRLTSTGWIAVMVATAFAAIPIATAIAILKYRLYDIDVVIGRTVVLGVLAGFITLVYALVVVGVGNLIGGTSDGLILPIAATAVVALAFEPVRHMAQSWANRMVYGQRATPYEVLSDLTERLSHGEEGEGLLARMAERLGDGTGAERATIWLGDETAMRVGASWPDSPGPAAGVDLDAEDVFPVTHDGVVVGAFEIAKPRGTALSTAERSLITDLAGSAGAVLGYQRLNDSLQAKVRELAESRARLVDVQDKERRRLERDLHDGAQQLIVALKVKIGLARAMAARHDAEDLERLLQGLGDEAQAALDEVRALAKGIYPPVLESDGLGPALSALASGSAEEVVVRSEGLGRYDRDIEAAIYFEISEAVTNAVKHASGPIRVELVGSDGEVRFSVQDSGPGFDLAMANGGSGLQNLRDRIDAVGGTLEIISNNNGTTVSGTVPLDPVRV
jgi:signal transduction histidine kinase